MTCSTRARVTSLTRSWPCTTLETVAVDTSASRATSYSVTTFPALGSAAPAPGYAASRPSPPDGVYQRSFPDLSAYPKPPRWGRQGPCPVLLEPARPGDTPS